MIVSKKYNTFYSWDIVDGKQGNYIIALAELNGVKVKFTFHPEHFQEFLLQEMPEVVKDYHREFKEQFEVKNYLAQIGAEYLSDNPLKRFYQFKLGLHLVKNLVWQ